MLGFQQKRISTTVPPVSHANPSHNNAASTSLTKVPVIFWSRGGPSSLLRLDRLLDDLRARSYANGRGTLYFRHGTVTTVIRATRLWSPIDIRNLWSCLKRPSVVIVILRFRDRVSSGWLLHPIMGVDCKRGELCVISRKVLIVPFQLIIAFPLPLLLLETFGMGRE
jgi:hypothetical protein